MIEFFKCEHCGQIIKKVVDTNVPVVCCGSKMVKIEPNTVDASKEKHVPVVTVDGNIVNVKLGSEEHPMTPMHLIEWVIIETDKGSYKYNFKATDKPECNFILREGEKLIHTYAFCNLHGLWKA